MNYAYFAASNARKILSTEVAIARKRTLADEEKNTRKRLKKQDNKRIWDAKEVFVRRGHTKEEIEVFKSVLPDKDKIYRVDDKLSS